MMKALIATLTLLTNMHMALAQVPQMPSVPAAVTKSLPPSSATATATTGSGSGTSQASALLKTASDKAVVHLNSASVEDLQKLPGIGPEKAKAIVAARPFKSIEDLKNVKGIKEATFAKIKDLVKL